MENKCRNCGVFFFVLFELCKRVCDFSAVGSANENQSFSSVTQPEQHQQGEHAIIILCVCVCVTELPVHVSAYVWAFVLKRQHNSFIDSIAASAFSCAHSGALLWPSTLRFIMCLSPALNVNRAAGRMMALSHHTGPPQSVLRV